MGGIAAVAICAAFTSCSKSNELFDQNAAEQAKQQTSEQKILDSYQKAFENAFGQPGANQDWGLAKYGSATNAGTRTITVNGDAYDKFPSADDVAANFPTAIPEGAVEVAELFDTYNGQEVPTQWGTTKLDNIWAIYANIVTEGFNLKITQAGTTELGGSYQNAAYVDGKNVAYPYNVYVDVDGDVTLKRNGSTHFNLYILKGNVTLESNYGEQAGLISVAAGATLNDRRNSIAANQGVKIFNKGTINATNTEKYDIGNFCTVYNEGKFNVTGALTYSPGDANTSYFMNLGDDAELTASAMTLNSAGNFFNDGKVVITGETKVTQKDIYWVNAGYYKTGSIFFSAKNDTFYNYCQLIVTGNAHMYDGEFNLMPNSYTEVATAEMDNFTVNMGGNTGINIKGAVRVIAQGAGIFQGFKNFGTNNYVLIGGKVTVDSHQKVFSAESGITYSIKEIEIVRGGSVVTEAQLQEEKSGDYPVLDLQGTEVPFGELTVTPKEFGQGCGASWNIPPVIVYQGSVMGEDLTAETDNDFDFNDVVFDWAFSADKKTAYIRLRAAGGTLPLKIGTAVGQGEEVHALFGVSTSTMVNTGVGADGVTKEAVEFEITKTDGTFKNAGDIIVSVDKTSKGANGYMQMTGKIGEAPCLLFVPLNTKWVDEYENIEKAYTWFGAWARGEAADQWTSAPVEQYVDLKLSNNK